MDLFLCVFILGNVAWSLWGEGERCEKLKLTQKRMTEVALKGPILNFLKGDW